MPILKLLTCINSLHTYLTMHTCIIKLLTCIHANTYITKKMWTLNHQKQKAKITKHETYQLHACQCKKNANKKTCQLISANLLYKKTSKSSVLQHSQNYPNIRSTKRSYMHSLHTRLLPYMHIYICVLCSRNLRFIVRVFLHKIESRNFLDPKKCACIYYIHTDLAYILTRVYYIHTPPP